MAAGTRQFSKQGTGIFLSESMRQARPRYTTAKR